MAGDYHRVSTRCDRCSSYWTVPPTESYPLCPCGGSLVPFDLKAETDKLPYVPMTSEPPQPKVK